MYSPSVSVSLFLCAQTELTSNPVSCVQGLVFYLSSISGLLESHLPLLLFASTNSFLALPLPLATLLRVLASPRLDQIQGPSVHLQAHRNGHPP